MAPAIRAAPPTVKGVGVEDATHDAGGPRAALHDAPTRHRVLIVDDDALVARSLCEFMREEGYQALSAGDAAGALEALAQAGAGPASIDVAICDIAIPGNTGLDLLRRIRREHPGVAVVILTGYGTIESAVEAVRLGASDFLVKPVVDAELRLALRRALQQRALMEENQQLRRRLSGPMAIEGLVGADPRMHRVYELVEAVAPSRTTVLMTGESGTGKSLVAHAIHQRSPRRDKAFVEISCGSIPETLLESELFGHVKGAFTGAFADKAGRFLAAQGGTIFLDEINSASPGMQLKLLRVLQERRFEPVGSNQTIEVDARVILATNQALEQLVADGRFRQDLYYRINVVRIDLPALRERPSDVPALASYFLDKHAAELGKRLVGFTPEAMDALARYAYPGNVRELQNIVERAAVLCRGQMIGAHDLPGAVLESRGSDVGPAAGAPDRVRPTPCGPGEPWVPMALDEALRAPERAIILRTLEHNNWNRQRTAETLGINRTTLYKRMKALGIEAREPEAQSPEGRGRG